MSDKIIPIVRVERFFDCCDSDFEKHLRESVAIWERFPEIEARIAADQNSHGEAKKLLRKTDEQYESNRSEPMSFYSDLEPLERTGCELKRTGSPRMPPFIVYIYAMAYGWLGSIHSRNARTVLQESLSIRSYLDSFDMDMPGISTIDENVKAISSTTLELMLRRQLAYICDCELDDFDKMYIDSTAVEGNSLWPTESGLILDSLERAVRLAGSLGKFGLESPSTGWLDKWLAEIREQHVAICFAKGNKGADKLRKRCYKRIYEISDKAVARLIEGLEAKEAEHQAAIASMRPSLANRAKAILEEIAENAMAAAKIAEYSFQRIELGKRIETKDKILSLSDDSAYMISKAGRSPIIGYKPQVIRSGMGFVSGIVLEPGNPSDSGQLVESIQAGIDNTGKTPRMVIVDDGYSSREGLGQAQSELNIETVSISGAKGRELLGEELWNDPEHVEARKNRSAVESTIYTLKKNHGFGRMGRRGLTSVRWEMDMKILAYNLDQILRVRRSQEEGRKRKAA